MSVDWIIKSLREEPEKWAVSGCAIEHVDDYVVIVRHLHAFEFGKLYNTPFIDRVRLRYAVWKWRRRQNGYKMPDKRLL